MMNQSPPDGVASATAPTLPTWWTSEIETSWRAARTRTLSSWGRSGKVPRKLLRRIAEAAVALGFGAHQAFPATPAWTIDLEAGLEREWVASGHGAQTPWARISVAVQHGWENSTGTGWRNPHLPSAVGAA